MRYRTTFAKSCMQGLGQILSLNKGKSSEFKSSAFTDSFTHINMTFHGTAIIYCLIPILLAFSLYCWPSPYTVGLLPILLAFSLYCWPSPYTVGLLPILLAFSLYCWPSPYTVGLLPILLAFSLYLCMTLYIVFPQTYRRSITAHTCTGLATQQNS